MDPDRNLAAWLDRKLFMAHLYNGTRDPEGIRTLPIDKSGTCCHNFGQFFGSPPLGPDRAWYFAVAALRAHSIPS
jgi:hypothetical protein